MENPEGSTALGFSDVIEADLILFFGFDPALCGGRDLKMKRLCPCIPVMYSLQGTVLKRVSFYLVDVVRSRVSMAQFGGDVCVLVLKRVH